jgi:hypothetical protein
VKEHGGKVEWCCASLLESRAIAQRFYLNTTVKEMQTSSYLYNPVDKHEIAKILEEQ